MIPTPLYEMEPLQNIIIMTGLERYHNNSRPLLYFIITELSSCYVVLCYEIISVGKATYVTLSWSQGWHRYKDPEFELAEERANVGGQVWEAGMSCRNGVWKLMLAREVFCWPVVSGPVKLIGNCDSRTAIWPPMYPRCAPNQHHREHRGWPVRLLQQAPPGTGLKILQASPSLTNIACLTNLSPDSTYVRAMWPRSTSEQACLTESPGRHENSFAINGLCMPKYLNWDTSIALRDTCLKTGYPKFHGWENMCLNQAANCCFRCFWTNHDNIDDSILCIYIYISYIYLSVLPACLPAWLSVCLSISVSLYLLYILASHYIPLHPITSKDWFHSPIGPRYLHAMLGFCMARNWLNLPNC